MRQLILNALKAKFEGVSDAILNRVADKLLKSVTKEEDVQTAVDGVTFQQVLESYGDSRATEATQTAVTNYEKKHGLKNGKPTAPEVSTEADTEQTGGAEAALKALTEQVRVLGEQVKTMQAERTTTDRRAELSKITGSLPASIRKAYDRIDVNTLTPEQFEELKTEITGEVAEIAKETDARGAVFGKPTVSGGSGAQKGGSRDVKEASEEEANDVVSRMGI